MAWIESHQSLRDHPKTKKLARLLGIPKVSAIGHLHCLWWWTLEYADDGDLSRFDDPEIADGAEWEGDPAQFLQAMRSSGFLDGDSNDEGSDLAIHEWDDYAGRLVTKREQNAVRQREWRERNKQKEAPNDHVITTSPLRNGHVQGLPNTTVPNRTKPNTTVPEANADTTQVRAREPSGRKKPDLTGFAEFWAVYPRRVARAAAELAWPKLKPDERQAALEAIREQIRWPCFADAPEDKQPHASTWLNNRRWEDEPPQLRAIGRASPSGKSHQDSWAEVDRIRESTQQGGGTVIEASYRTGD